MENGMTDNERAEAMRALGLAVLDAVDAADDRMSVDDVRAPGGAAAGDLEGQVTDITESRIHLEDK
jgi:hypothetical protein